MMDVIQPPSIAVLTVATNIYFEYWKEMVRSADKVSAKSDRVTFFVFTERVGEIQGFSESLRNVEVVGFVTPPYRWPDATLLRYQIFDLQTSRIPQDIVMHLDADMLFVSNPWSEVRSLVEENEICLVRHPGYWRERSLKRILFYASHPHVALRDFRLMIRLGGLGSWETNSASFAFVSRELREKYFCGGVWFGRKSGIFRMIEDLKMATDIDLQNGVVAIWHDESHLNRWASVSSYGEASPAFCFDRIYPQLHRLAPLIVAVRKTSRTR